MDDFTDDGGQASEGGAEFVGAGGAGLGWWRFSRQWNGGSSGGVGLFFLFIEEGEDELFMTHLFALGSVEALEECRDDAFLGGEFGFEGSDFRGELGDLFVWCFDVFSSSNWRAYHDMMLCFFIDIHTMVSGVRRAGRCHRLAWRGRWA